MSLDLCVQAGTILTKSTILDQYDSIQLIVDWPEKLNQTLQGYMPPISMWRWTQDPRLDPRWPHFHLSLCRYAQFANEPDIEGPLPNWYYNVADLWHKVGGYVLSVPYSDQSKWQPSGVIEDIMTCHCYAGDFHNYEIALQQARGKPVWITEYAHQWAQEHILEETESYLDSNIPIYAFIWTWLPPGNQPGFDLDTVVLNRPKVGAQR